jgi:ParB-like chromosome segregation protein Spo0J
MENKLTAPLSTLQWVEREKLHANDWNPNKVSRENLDLLVKSILSNGWTLPIVCRPDYTIIDGYHRWTVAGEEPLKSKLKGKVPVVIVKHNDTSGDVYGTVTHNRARGTHLLEPMKNIVKRLLEQGKSIKDISKELGMKQEEIFRLTDISKEEFLKLMASRTTGYSKELYIRKM